MYMPFLLVTDTPTNFTATRTGLQTAFTSWTAPTSNDPPVEGYEVFYESEYGVRSSGGTTTAPKSKPHPQLPQAGCQLHCLCCGIWRSSTQQL